jgi:DNA replication and repair protein RecF
MAKHDKFSDHVGFIPLVIISPADRDLIVEGSETRRKFMDSVISAGLTIQHLIQYQKVLNQRNALLKYFALNRVLKTTPSPFIMNNLMGMVNISSIKENSYLNLYLSLTTTITTRSPDRKKQFK